MRARVAIVLLAGCGRLGFDPLGSSDGGGGSGSVRVVQVACGTQHTCVRSNLGQLACWGDNEWGMLGQGDTLTRGNAPGPLPTVNVGSGAVGELESVSDFTCARAGTATKCWGNNDGAQLGTGDHTSRGDMPNQMGDELPAVPLPTESIGTGHYHACALAAGAVRCWGSNQLGELGYGDTMPRDTLALITALPAISLGTDFAPVAMWSGFNQTCALTADQRLKCWGYNTVGNLGLGDTTTRGDDPAGMGDALPEVDLGGAATTLSIGIDHICAVLTDGSVKCWGPNNSGQLGVGDTETRGDQPGEMGMALPAVELGTGARATQVATGREFSCALLATGDVKCWGSNDHGQLGQGDTTTRGDAPGQLGDALSPIPLAGPASEISAGQTYACAALVSGDVQCWGSNNVGQLGRGDTMDRGITPGDLTGVISAASLWP
jgi:alpha-tubulin suppressor-like RCC1 family protein